MATFKTCVRKQRKDGFYPVYIRISQGTEVKYLKTGKLASQSAVSKQGEVNDPYIQKYCSDRIVEYVEMLNKVDTRNWNLAEVVRYLESGEAEISFSLFARRHIDQLINDDQERTAKNYSLALKSLELFAGTNKVNFSQLTSPFINAWIKSLAHTHRAKEMYPICIRQVFKSAQLYYNDYDNGILRIKNDPWRVVLIPKSERPQKLAITPQECRAFFSAPIPESKMKSPIPELGRDVALMTLCLAGINTVDLYRMKKEDYRNGILAYKRAKTTKFRRDEAYFEIRVPAMLQPTIEKYLAPEGDEYLFVFRSRYSTSDSFNANVNLGIKKICESMGIAKEDRYSAYTFRHTWGTIAQNDCGASIADVAFAMNHAAGHTITRGYIKIDFSPAWKLNEEVVNLVFFTNIESSRDRKEEENVFERFSPKYLIHGWVYFRGECFGEVEDIGYNNIDEVINALWPFVPDYIPDRAMLQFKIRNVDKQQEVVYERMKRHK